MIKSGWPPARGLVATPSPFFSFCPDWTNSMVWLKKALPGSDSHGHVWAEHGDVVEVDDHVARSLLLIRDAGFSIAAPPAEPEELEVVVPPGEPVTGLPPLPDLDPSFDFELDENGEPIRADDSVDAAPEPATGPGSRGGRTRKPRSEE